MLGEWMRVGVFVLAVSVVWAGCTRNSPEGRIAEQAGEIADGDVSQSIVVPSAAFDLGEPFEEDEPVPFEQPELPSGEIVGSTYTIGPADLLFFRSLDDPSLDGPVTVRSDGYVSLPWIPDIRVAGLTRQEATLQLQAAYNEIYIDAEVSLAITEANSQVYYVMGDVSQPGEFPYTRPIRLLDGINRAGGIRVNRQSGDSFVSAQGQLVRAFVIRTVDGERQVLDYDLRDLEQPGSHASQAAIFSNDIIYVPEGINLVYLVGEVARPDVYPLRQGMTLLQLLAQANGFNESTARLRQVVILRPVNDEETQLSLVDVKSILATGRDPRLRAGDIVYVPRRPMVNAAAAVDRFTSTVSPVLSLGDQIMSLYLRGYDVRFVDERFDRLLDDPTTSTVGITELVTLLGGLAP